MVATVANRGEDKSNTIHVGTDVYVCLPFTLMVKKKGAKKRGRKKRETVNLHTSHHSHHGVGGYSKLINGLRAAASAWRLCTPTSALTVHMLKMYCKEGMSVVLSFTTLFITRKREK